MSSGIGRTPRPPDRLADRYEVQEPIGQGATAITYRGWDERLERIVAIKILRQEIAEDDSYLRRFRQEARSAASVAHGNVVDVYDFGQEEGVLYIVMQHVDGEDLKHLILREAPLAPDRVWSIIRQVLDGLQAIHTAGIVHRDIKPQNVLIGQDGIARVTDFGIAHLDEDIGLTTAGTTVGTAAYMAPEQAQGGRVSQATDLYAVGVMIYEMLTGYLPFNGPTAMATMLEHIQNDAVPPSQRLPGRGITPAMDSVVLQALTKDPERRFNSARAMRQAVGHVLGSDGSRSTAQNATVVMPAAQSTMRARPVRQGSTGHYAAPRPNARQPVGASAPRERHTTRDEGSGLGGAVRGLLTVLALGMFAVLAWFLFENLDDSGSGTGEPTATIQATETPAPTATEASSGIIEPISPTDAPPPTEIPVPTETSAPTETPEPTPTSTPEPTPTPEPTVITEPSPTAAIEPIDDGSIIEPIDITPFPTIEG